MPSDLVTWLREQAEGPMSHNPEHADVCNRLTDAANEIERLRAIVDKVRDYDHHAMQAQYDEEDGAIDPAYYGDAEDEVRLAQQALDEAVLISRGWSAEAAATRAAEAAGGNE